MRLDKGIIEKIRNENNLLDRELKEAIQFYTEMAEGLRCLGPEFFIAWRPVLATRNKLEEFKKARLRKW